VKRFTEALKKRATVLPMDEYQTSKLCSQRHCRLKEARLRTKDKDDRLVSQENRNVLRCANSRCKATLWNRDVNAARNTLELLSARLLGFERIPAFAR
jgi:transposase